ncbi:MAG TPA: hypothetical protein PKY22_11260, partial [Accumulibacter sp.]|nr:hypothetical protein [Accumulibacter sp.]
MPIIPLESMGHCTKAGSAANFTDCTPMVELMVPKSGEIGMANHLLPATGSSPTGNEACRPYRNRPKLKRKINLQPARDDGVDFSLFERFSDEIVHPGLKTALAIIFKYVGGYRDDGQGLCFGDTTGTFARANTLRRLETVELGHLTVHQYHVETLCRGHVDRFQAVLRDANLQAEICQEGVGDQLVDGIILDQEYVTLKTPIILSQR